jgi:hypothetical protein
VFKSIILLCFVAISPDECTPGAPGVQMFYAPPLHANFMECSQAASTFIDRARYLDQPLRAWIEDGSHFAKIRCEAVTTPAFQRKP